MQLLKKYGIALIKRFYEEASDYYSQQEKIKTKIKQLENAEIKTRIVKKKQNLSNNSNSSLINLGNLIEGGGID